MNCVTCGHPEFDHKGLGDIAFGRCFHELPDGDLCPCTSYVAPPEAVEGESKPQPYFIIKLPSEWYSPARRAAF